MALRIQINTALLDIQALDSDSSKSKWIQKYKNDRSHYLSFPTFYVSKIAELYMYDELCNNGDSITDQKLDNFISEMMERQHFEPLSNNIGMPTSLI